MELLVTLGRTLGFSLAAGVNLYATIALVGLAARYEWVSLPEQFDAFDNPWIIGAAGVLYTVEFFADKIPWIDTLWDSVHTFIRPIGGALVAVPSVRRLQAPRPSSRSLAERLPPAAMRPRPARAWWPTPARSRCPTGS
jgi:hypothetical protein